MKTHISRILFIIALTLAGGGYAQAEQLTVAFGNPADNVGTGSRKAETIDVAFHLSDPALVGLEVQTLRIPFATVEGITAARAWLATDLPTISKSLIGEPNVATFDITPAEGYVDLTLSEPYTITTEGIYVGYSVDVEAADVAPTPIVTTGVQTPESFFIHSTKTYRTAWHDFSATAGALALQVLLGGDGVKTNAVGVSNLSELHIKAGETSTVDFQVANHGTAGATTIDYAVYLGTYPAADAQLLVSYSAGVALEPYFGSTQNLKLLLPAIEAKGRYDYTVVVTSVNGVANEDVLPYATATANVYNTLPVHRPILEEYTGTWCGYCPRGFVGLEEMQRLYPGEFIGISYHNGDPMEVTSQYPNRVAGYPDAWIDRWYQTDAFCGDDNYGLFGIDKVWLKVRNRFAPAAVEVASEWVDDATLRATASVAFPMGSSECPYEVGFALVADGLSGEGSDWSQSNYYSGETDWPASMDEFTKGESHVSGLTFNFVLIARSGVAGLEGSLRAPIEEDVAQTVTYDFDIDAIKADIVPADRSKLRVVAMLINKETGEVANANQAAAGTATSAVGSLAATAADVPVSVTHYDLSGRRAASDARGLTLRVERTAGGSQRVTKVLR